MRRIGDAAEWSNEDGWGSGDGRRSGDGRGSGDGLITTWNVLLKFKTCICFLIMYEEVWRELISSSFMSVGDCMVDVLLHVMQSLASGQGLNVVGKGRHVRLVLLATFTPAFKWAFLHLFFRYQNSNRRFMPLKECQIQQNAKLTMPRDFQVTWNSYMGIDSGKTMHIFACDYPSCRQYPANA